MLGNQNDDLVDELQKKVKAMKLTKRRMSERITDEKHMSHAYGSLKVAHLDWFK